MLVDLSILWALWRLGGRVRCGLAPVFSFIILETAQAIAHIILNPKCELSFPPLPPPSNVHLLHLRTLRVRCIFTLCLQTRTQTLQGASFFLVALKFCSLVFRTRNCVRRGWTKKRYNFLWLYASDASLAYIWCSSSTVPSQVPANHFLS